MASLRHEQALQNLRNVLLLLNIQISKASQYTILHGLNLRQCTLVTENVLLQGNVLRNQEMYCSKTRLFHT